LCALFLRAQKILQFVSPDLIREIEGMLVTQPEPSSKNMTPNGKSHLDSPDLGVLRTSMALDRTFMAWVRKSLGLMILGLILHKMFQVLTMNGGKLPNRNTPRNAAEVLS